MSAAAVAAVRAAGELEDGLPEALAENLAAASLALARRLSSGATLWCASPAWPHHAQHVAVEFVHPVIVGKAALPAVALPSHDMVAAARANVSHGDVLLLVADAADPVASELARRAPAWGASALWIGAGQQPAAGAADHVLWLTDDENAQHDGRFILLYHLLWELVQVCLEHGGLLSEEVCEAPVCMTCSDEGRLVELATVAGTTGTARAERGWEDVDLTLLGTAMVHDLVLVHAGSALTRIDPR